VWSCGRGGQEQQKSKKQEQQRNKKQEQHEE